MKKLYTVITVSALALLVGVTAVAQGKMGTRGSKKSDCCCSARGEMTPEIKKFKADTIDLRQEMMNKRFDLQRENLKETPDSARVDSLNAEIAAIKGKIEAIRESSQLPESVCHKACQMMDEDGSHCSKDRKHGCNECGKGKSCKDCCKSREKNCRDCMKSKECKNCTKKK